MPLIENPPDYVSWWVGNECHIRTPDYEAVLCPTHLEELNR